MSTAITVAHFLLSLSILIVLHEGGHYLAARMFKIKVEKFYLFFDFLFPFANIANFSLLKFKKGDTEYGLGWFPLGGYVKIAGMVDESMDKDQMQGEPQPWEFRTKPAWQRLIVMLGGIIVNVIVGMMIFTGITWILGETHIPMKYVNDNGGIYSMAIGDSLGLKTGDKILKINGSEFETFSELRKPSLLLSEDSYYTVQRGDSIFKLPIPNDFIKHFTKRELAGAFVSPRIAPIVNSVKDSTIAARVGLVPGDRIIEVQGQPIRYFDEVQKQVKAIQTDSIQFKIERAGAVLSFNENFKGEPGIGFYINSAEIVPKNVQIHKTFTFWQSLVIGPQKAFDVITMQIQNWKKIFKRQVSLSDSLSGPVGMAKNFTGDWETFWFMTGLISMALAFMNLLPIPGLDGGYAVFLLYEMITGKEPNEKVFENSLKVGFIILLAIMIFAFYNDFTK